jgi:hypothetical protein
LPNKHSLERPVRQFLGFDTISVTQDTVNQFAVQGLAVRGQPAMEFGQLFLIAFHPAGNYPLMPSRFDPPLFSDPSAVGVFDPPGRFVVIRVVQPPLSLNRPLQPGDFSFLVGNIGSKEFQTGVGIADKGDGGRADVQADFTLADYLVRLLVRFALIDQLGVEAVSAPNLAPHQPDILDRTFQPVPDNRIIRGNAQVEDKSLPLDDRSARRLSQQDTRRLVLAFQAVKLVPAFETGPSPLADGVLKCSLKGAGCHFLNRVDVQMCSLSTIV